MDGYIIIISILIILLCFYFMKYNENENKYLPVMIKQKQVISQLKDEMIKIKSKLKYLQEYKNDISKTFKILDNELVMINDTIKMQTENVVEPEIRPSLFQTSFTPSVLSSLINSVSNTIENEPIQTTTNESELFSNIFNRFLTGQNISESTPVPVPVPVSELEQRQFIGSTIPLNNSYRQFLLNRDISPEQIECEQEINN